MKRFRFATIHLVLIGLILFGILAISIRLVHTQLFLLLIALVIFALVIALLYYQKFSYELSEQEQIELLNDQTEGTLKRLLEQMPVGVIQFDPDTFDIEWFNPYAELIFTDEAGNFLADNVREIIAYKRESSANQVFELSGNKYAAYLDLSSGMFYFFDMSQGYRQLGSDSAFRPVIGIISVDNYDDMIDSLSDSQVSQVNSFVSNFISEFAHSKGIYYRRVNMDRFYFFTDYSVLKELIDGKFSVMDEFRKQSQEAQIPLTLSMGISFGSGKHNQIGQIALQNLNTALVRGGDQVVVRENDDNKKALYFGGGSVSTVKRSRTRTRAMMTAISDRMKVVDSVFVVGHRRMDMDALGASIGMQFFASNIVNASYAIYDPSDLNVDVSRAVASLLDDGETRLITVNRALELVTPRSLLVMVDHSKISLTLSEELYSKFTDVIVVDHHRRDEGFPQNAVLSFIESGASSASELVTELIQFQQAKKRLSSTQASILMAGIMLDTKNFAANVTSRTFDVASYLRGLGSNSTEIQTISAIDFEEYRSINELILRGERTFDQMIIATGEDDKLYTNVITSKAADTLLAMAGIEATFVITRTGADRISISARSRSKINVQRIMETMGGGGHFNLAACQLTNVSTIQAKELLFKTIKEDLVENHLIENEE